MGKTIPFLNYALGYARTVADRQHVYIDVAYGMYDLREEQYPARQWTGSWREVQTGWNYLIIDRRVGLDAGLSLGAMQQASVETISGFVGRTGQERTFQGGFMAMNVCVRFRITQRFSVLLTTNVRTGLWDFRYRNIQAVLSELNTDNSWKSERKTDVVWLPLSIGLSYSFP